MQLRHDGDDPLQAVNSGAADYAVVDENAFVYSRHQYPDVIAAFTLPDPRPLHWMTAAGAVEICASVDSFFTFLARSKRLGPLLRDSAPEAQEFHYEIARRFQADIVERLPELRPWFEEAEQETGVDWRLLAALAYQESRWDASARTDDGAQGIMMLTEAAAKAVNVTDRNDPRNSILGGARYFVTVRAKVPARISEPDRTWLALAAYNTGFGHMEDARVLAQARGKNPDRWVDVREALPLLEQERFYLQSRNGYARGWEPVRLVDQIQLFLNFLEWGGAAPATTPSTEGDGAQPKPAENAHDRA
jgi:membrane-bound lytic murein transglycosylase F